MTYKGGAFLAPLLPESVPEPDFESFLKVSVNSLMETIFDCETKTPEVLAAALRQLTRFLEDNEKVFTPENCLNRSQIEYLMSLLQTADPSALKELFDVATGASRIPFVCASFLDCDALETLFRFVQERPIRPDFVQPLFLCMNHFGDRVYAENHERIQQFPFRLFQSLPPTYRIDVLNLFIAVAKHVTTIEIASDFILSLLDPPADASTASRIAWIMYYLISGPLRREVGIFDVLVMMVDHPTIRELPENLFWAI
jgi:hypothetical protein